MGRWWVCGSGAVSMAGRGGLRRTAGAHDMNLLTCDVVLNYINNVQVLFLPEGNRTSLNSTCWLTIGSYLIAAIFRRFILKVNDSILGALRSQVVEARPCRAEELE
jgi:hypothetical protein